MQDERGNIREILRVIAADLNHIGAWVSFPQVIFFFPARSRIGTVAHRRRMDLYETGPRTHGLLLFCNGRIDHIVLLEMWYDTDCVQSFFLIWSLYAECASCTTCNAYSIPDAL